MSVPRTLAWLADFQAQFSALLRAPLDRTTGTLRAPSEQYDGSLTALVEGRARDRLAVYHRQYWFRLFTSMQREYPLCARLVGMWSFNELSAGYLVAHPPRHIDLQHESQLFVPYLEHVTQGERSLYGVPCAALREAARIDRAFSRVFLAPEVPPLAALPRADLFAHQLTLSPTVELLAEHWPLIELRRSIGDGDALTLPAPHEDTRYWAVFRTARGHGVAPLEPLAHRLFSLLAAQPIGAALAELEESCSEAERGALPAQVQSLLARSVELAFWQQPSAEP